MKAWFRRQGGGEREKGEEGRRDSWEGGERETERQRMRESAHRRTAPRWELFVVSLACFWRPRAGVAATVKRNCMIEKKTFVSHI